MERRADAFGLRLAFAHRAARAFLLLAALKLVVRFLASPVPALPPIEPSATAAGFLLGIVGLHPAFALWADDGLELCDALGIERVGFIRAVECGQESLLVVAAG